MARKRSDSRRRTVLEDLALATKLATIELKIDADDVPVTAPTTDSTAAVAVRAGGTSVWLDGISFGRRVGMFESVAVVKTVKVIVVAGLTLTALASIFRS